MILVHRVDMDYQSRRRKGSFSGEDELIRDNMKMSRIWIADEGADQHNMRAQQQQHVHQRVASDVVSPAALPLSLQQRAMAAIALQEIRNIDPSKRILQPQQQQHSQRIQQQAPPPLLVLPPHSQQSAAIQYSPSLQHLQQMPTMYNSNVSTSASQSAELDPMQRPMQRSAQAAMSQPAIYSFSRPSQAVIASPTTKGNYEQYPSLPGTSASGIIEQQQQQQTKRWFSSMEHPQSSKAGASTAAELPAADRGGILYQDSTISKDHHYDKKQQSDHQTMNSSTIQALSGFVSSAPLSQNKLAIDQTATTSKKNVAAEGTSGIQQQLQQQQLNSNNSSTKQMPTRTYTKVYKLGSIGRAIDVARFKNYVELKCELARMFGLEGQLEQKSGWQLVFVDKENDLLLVGDDPWEEFVNSVRGIRILSPSEVSYYTSDEKVEGSA